MSECPEVKQQETVPEETSPEKQESQIVEEQKPEEIVKKVHFQEEEKTEPVGQQISTEIMKDETEIHKQIHQELMQVQEKLEQQSEQVDTTNKVSKDSKRILKKQEYNEKRKQDRKDSRYQATLQKMELIKQVLEKQKGRRQAANQANQERLRQLESQMVRNITRMKDERVLGQEDYDIIKKRLKF